MPFSVGSPYQPPTYRIFLSSGDDAKDLRNRVDDLVREALNSQLIEADVNLRLEIDRWERTAAATNPGEDTNKQFVKRALKSQLTLALLIDDIGGGTREEIEAVLDAEKEVSALWFVPEGTEQKSEVADFLKPNRDRLLYDRTGKPSDKESWHGVVRVLFRLVLEGLKQNSGSFYVEERPGPEGSGSPVI